MRRIARVFVLFLSLSGGAALAQDPLPAVQKALRAEFTGLAASRKVPGLSVALIVDGQVRWIESFGHADRASRRALGNDSRHALGDLSKPFIAALALQLAAAGKLQPEAPVTRYLPQLQIAGGDAGAVSLNQLLSHHAGLPPNQLAGLYREVGAAAPARSPPAEALYFSQPPGTSYAYSNIGMELAAQALAAAGGAGYAQLLQDRVLTPLGLDTTGFVPREDDARGHRKGRPAAPLLAREQAALGLRASIADLARFAANLTAAEPAADLSALFRGYNGDSVLDLDYRNGLAYSLFADQRAEVGTVARLVSESPGFRGRMDIALRQRVAVIVLANAEEAGDAVNESTDTLLDTWLQAAHGIAPRQRNAALPAQAEWPAAAQRDSPARYYSSAAGLIALSPDGEDLDVRVLGLRFSAEPRPDGWYRLHLRLLGLPLDLGPLRRILVAPAVVAGRRVLMLWSARRRFLIGTAWQPPALDAPTQALAGPYKLLNPDRLSGELGIAGMRIELADGVLCATYPLDTPLLKARVPLQPEGAGILRVPGLGWATGERLRVERAEGRVRLHYSGYVFEHE